MKSLILDRIKRFNWVSLVQSCWVLLALIISIGQAKSQGLNDPTQPPEAVIELMPKPEEGDVLEWRLQGLKAEGKQGVAIVNGNWIAVGKEYEGYRLVQVTQTQALFVNNAGNRKILSLGVNPFQTAPKSVKKQVIKSKTKKR